MKNQQQQLIEYCHCELNETSTTVLEVGHLDNLGEARQKILALFLHGESFGYFFLSHRNDKL